MVIKARIEKMLKIISYYLIFLSGVYFNITCHNINASKINEISFMIPIEQGDLYFAFSRLYDSIPFKKLFEDLQFVRDSSKLIRKK